MATSIQLLRSNIAQLRPDPATLAEGMPMVNLNETEPGLFFRLRDGSLAKVGPVHIGTLAPNSSAQGFAGNSIGEQWVDTSGSSPILKVWDGTAWLQAGGGGGGSGQKGEPGDKGTTGDKGDTGQKGQAGTGGTVGAKGQKGEDGLDGDKGQKGVAPALLNFEGAVPTVGDLPAGAAVGDAYYVIATGEYHAWYGTGWANVGNISKGERGQKGDTGANGSKGQKGEDGIGIKGDAGTAGTAGVKGDVGPKGEAGVKGEKGQEGKGDKGEPGTVGAKGEQGATGGASPALYFRGNVANSGALPAGASVGDVYLVLDQNTYFAWDGATPVGTWYDIGQVAKGDTGQKGEKGLDGNGTKGQQGQKGQKGEEVKGDAGPTGAKGAEGEKGIDGQKGEEGAKGQKGEKGQEGAKGDEGEKGQKGAKGSTGNKGQKGEEGPVAGAAGEVVFNLDGTNPGGDPDFTFDPATNTLSTADIVTTGSHEIRNSPTQDGIKFAGRTGGTGDFDVTLTPTTLSADHTLTLPDESGTILTTASTGVVTSAMIVDNEIVNADINAAAGIEVSKLESMAPGTLIVGDVSSEPAIVPMSGDATLSDTGQIDIIDDVNLGGDPTTTTQLTSDNSTKVATTAFVQLRIDEAVQGLDVKTEVRATTDGTNITLSTLQTVDGVVLAVGDRVLVKDQTDPNDNGIYEASAGAWTRPADADDFSELVGAFVFTSEGTLNVDSGFFCQAQPGGTIGSDPIPWTQFSGAGQIIAGGGMTKNGNQLDVNTADPTRIVVNGDDIDLATTPVAAGSYREVTVDTYGRAVAGSNPTTFAGYGLSDTSANLAAALTDETGSGSAVFADSPVLTGTPTAPTPAAGDNSTTLATTSYVDSAVSQQSLNDGDLLIGNVSDIGVGRTMSGDATIDNTGVITIEPGAVDSGKILDGSIQTVDIGDNQIITAKILNGAVTTDKINDGAVTTAKILDGTIQTADLADNAITTGKITDGSVTTAKIADDAITSAKILDGTIQTADLSDSSITSAKILDGTIATADIANSAITSAKIADGTIITADIADSAVTTVKINDAAVTTAKLADNSVTSAKIVDGTIDTDDLADAAITSAKIADGTIVTADLSNSSVTSAKIVDGTIQTADLADSSVTSAKIADGTIVNADIATATIQGDRLVPNIVLPGSPSTLTQAQGDNSDNLATTEYADTAVNNAVSAITSLNDTNIYVGDATNTAQGVAMSGDATIDNTGVVSLANDLALTGNPTATTQTAGDDSNRLATTSYVETAVLSADRSLNDSEFFVGDAANLAQGVAMSGDATLANTGAVTIKTDVALAGNPTTTTQAAGDNSTRIATTAYVENAVLSGDISLNDANILVGDASNVAQDVAMSGDATIDNTGAVTIKTDLALAGNPTTTTQTAGDNSTRLATTAYVETAVLNGDVSLNDGSIFVGDASNLAQGVTMSGDVTIDNAGVASIKTDVGLAGNPTTTTQAVGDNSTRIATTAYVESTVLNGDVSLNDGNIFVGDASNLAQGVALSGDATVTNAGVLSLANNLALSGNPTTTTQSPGDNSTRLATTAYVDSATPSLNTGEIFIGDGSNTAISTAMTGDVTITTAGVTNISDNVNLGGGPTTTTQASGTNDTTIATTAFVTSAIAGGAISLNSSELLVGDASNVAQPVALSGDATIDNAGVLTIANNVNLAGTPTTTTQTAGDNSTAIATTAYVDNAVPGLPQGDIFIGDSAGAATAQTMSGDVTITDAGVTVIKSSVALAGTPTTTTQTAGDNSVAVSTTAYVDSAVAASNVLANANVFIGDASNVAQPVALSGDATLTNTGQIDIIDNVNLGGNPTTTTQPANTNDTTIATTAYVDAALPNLNSAEILVGDSGNQAAPVALSGDATIDDTGALTIIDNVALGGTPTTTTQTAGDNSTAISTTAYVDSAIATSTTLNNANIYVGDASNVAQGVAMSGDATIDNAGAVTIANDAVTTAKIIDGAVTSAKIADGTIVTADIADGAVNSAKILDDTIVNADINTAAGIEFSKLEALNSAQVVLGSNLNVPTATAVTGDVTISDTGVTVIKNDVALAGNPTTTTQLITDNSGKIATTAYVSLAIADAVQGLDTKDAVAAATDGTDITLSGTQTIDGVALNAGDRVLVKDQTNQEENGIYVVGGGAWVRADDSSTWDELVGAFVFVQNGTLNERAGFTSQTAAGGTLGTDPIPFAQFNSSVTYNNGSGLSLTGTQFAVVSADTNAITVGAGGIDLALSGVATGTYSIVTVDEHGRVTSGSSPTDLSNYGVTLNSADIFVGDASNEPKGVTMSGDATIDNAGVLTIANDAITSAKIADGTIVNADIANSTIQGGKLVGSIALAGSPTTTTQAAGDNSTKISTTAYVDAAVTSSAPPLTNSEIFVGDSSNVPQSVAMSGDATIDNTGALTIASSVNLTGAPTTTTATAGDNSTKISTTAYVDAAVTASNTLNDTNIFVGNASNVATGVAMSGDATVDNTGAVTIVNDAITTVKILDDAVTGAKIADDVALAGNPTTTTQAAGTNNTTIATTAYVDNAVDIGITLNQGDIYIGDASNEPVGVTMSGDATIDNAGAVTIKNDVALAGNPTTTTQTAGDNSTKIATTAYVESAVLSGDRTLNDTNIFVGDGSNLAVGVAMSGDATIANTGAITIKDDLALGGSPTTTTQTQGDNSTKVSTTAYVDAAIAAVPGAAQLNSAEIFLGNAANATAQVTISGDITLDNVGVATIKNDVALAGSPTTTTQTQGDNSTKISTTAYVDAAIAAVPGAAQLNSAEIFLGNASNATAQVTISGDVTLDNAGVSTIKNDVALAGSPTTTTQTQGDNSTKISTTAYVDAAIAAVPGAAQLNSAEIFLGNAANATAQVTISGDVTLDNTGVATIKNDVALAGSPTTTTQTQGDNSTKISTTAYVDAAIAAVPVAAQLNSGEIFLGNAANATAQVVMSGDATISNTGVLTIANDAVTTVKILDANVTGAKIEDNVALAGSPTTTTQTAGDNSTKISTTAYVESAIAASNVLANAEIFVGDGSNTAVGVAMSGDATIDNAGAVTIANDAVTTAKIIDGAVTSAKILDDTIVNADINSAAAIDYSKLAPITAASIVIGNSATVPTVTAISGDVTLSDTGVVDIIDDVNLGGNPTTATQLVTDDSTRIATTAYVQLKVADAIQGLDTKEAVAAATTANITLSGTQTIDGQALNAGDRVLVKNQTNADENGIYAVDAGAWSRADDASTWDELVGAFVFVQDGTLNGNAGYVSQTASGGTLGTDPIPFVQFNSSAGAIAGAGIDVTGTTISVVTEDTANIVVSGSGVNLATTGVAAGTYTSTTVDTYGRVTSGTTPTTFAGYSISDTSANLAAAITDETGTGSLVFADSPALTGVPTAPTATAGDNSTQIATTAYVDTSGLFEIVGGAITPKTDAQDVAPVTDGGASLGTATLRWANVFTQDMHFNNTGTAGNEIDGTTGHWQLQEGEDSLYLINRLTGGKFRISMESVD